MAVYKARQIAAIEEAVMTGRRALKAAQNDDPRVFAHAYVAAGGVQIPGQPAAKDAAQALGRALLESLARNTAPAQENELLRFEWERVQQETEWVRQARDERVVGFRLVLSPAAERDMACAAISKQDHGYGRNLFPRLSIVVLPPQALGSRFVPVSVDEVEC
ncbi:hypothetical protein [Alkalilimnicola sp. S0819]|uniref:hypothetical protein n=1 Tax=Alkalilimnicola sp. S0819 TaxID=2613922 RepID=UPI00126285A5|nr:hypothetical protein [Alkalilimnicola sp. S0819]KAB7619545.1 hypothetical protein F3N43_13505 [Alkalilimnicola sp. S0819]MPQ17652.1 hypothetical protein [Alkalilimnicola sp. S0819]